MKTEFENTNSFGAKKRRAPEVPQDLNFWVGGNRLLNLVYDAIHSTHWPEPLKTREPGMMPEPALRSLLTYCYAVGIFSSKDIEAASFDDRNVRYICANYFPDWQQIRNFRRQNSVWLKASLTRLFLAAYWERNNHQENLYSFWSEERFTENAPDFDAEAEERLSSAIQADSMAMDI